MLRVGRAVEVTTAVLTAAQRRRAARSVGGADRRPARRVGRARRGRRPERVGHDGAGLGADQRCREVVPHAVGVGAHVDEAVERSRRRRGTGRAPRPRARGTAPSRVAAGRPADPDDRRRDGRATPTAPGACRRRRHAPSPRTAAKRSPDAWLATSATAGPSSSTRHSAVAHHGTPRLEFVDPSSGSITTIRTVAARRRARSPPTAAEPGAAEHRQGGRVGDQVDRVLPQHAGPTSPQSIGRRDQIGADGVGALVEADQDRVPPRPGR